MTRRPLPTRRPSWTIDTTHHGLPISVMVGCRPDTGEVGV